jgi:prolyl oligopeptidase
MKRAISLLVLLIVSGCATKPSRDSDPYLWLEGVDDPKALAWVAEQNERTRRELASTPGFEEMRQHALTALSSRSRVPSLAYHGRYLYNLWKDAQHPRGLYRRTTLAQLQSGNPQWTTVLDIDAMSARDAKQWVFKGLDCLAPEERRCLVSLSAGGGDAIEIREFDTETLQFIENGFFLPAAKSRVDWMDENTLLVATDFGPGTLSQAGYPRVVKRWTRGTPLAAATKLYEAPASSVGVTPRQLRYEGGHIDVIEDATTFWNTNVYRIDGAALQRVDIPETSNIAGAIDGGLVVVLEDAWGNIPTGSVVHVRGEDRRVVASPTSSAIIETEGVEVAGDVILVPMLENVRARLRRFAVDGTSDIIPFPDNGALSIMTTDGDSGDALVSFQTFTDPPALYLVRRNAVSVQMVEKILQQEPTFDGSRFETTQQWAVSKDGTRIPYFVVGAKGFPRNGSNPTHIFSYGGFRNALTPSYSGSYEQHYGAYGKLWLERGGVFVLANIRGGGEFGPQWHSSVLKENRPKVIEDFEAVAEDLVRTGITTAKRIGIEGRSNGGLLTLTAIARRPELYGSAISGAPLADMRRYQGMLAGASWAAEYGDAHYSPYHELKRGMNYPPLFVYASTRDDRVHPGHARKTVARMLELGYPVWYYENVEGGHGGSSTNEQLAYRIALSYAHLWRTAGKP